MEFLTRTEINVQLWHHGSGRKTEYTYSVGRKLHFHDNIQLHFNENRDERFPQTLNLSATDKKKRVMETKTHIL